MIIPLVFEIWKVKMSYFHQNVSGKDAIFINSLSPFSTSDCHTVVVGLIDLVLWSGHLKYGPDVVDDAGDLKLVEDKVVSQIGILSSK